MVPYNPAGIRMNQYALIEHLRVQVRRRRRHERRLLVKPPPPKIVFVVVKQKSVTYVERLEHNVEDGIDCLVCFDARYLDPNLRYNVVTKTWIHYVTPGLFRNATYLNVDTGVWLPLQLHPQLHWI